MKTIQPISQPGNRTIYVEYHGDRYNEAVDAAIAGSRLKTEQVTVIAVPRGLKLGRKADR